MRRSPIGSGARTASCPPATATPGSRSSTLPAARSCTSTPASPGFVGPIGSMMIGVAAGIICYWGCTGLKHMFGYDDALDAFGVHAVGGIVGALLTGVFAIEQYGGTAGLIEGNPGQVLNQIYGVAIVIVYDVIVSLILLKIIDMVIGLRVTSE